MSETKPGGGLAIMVANQLADDFEGLVAREEIDQVVEAHVEDFADATVPNFVPTLVARRAREELEHRGQEGGTETQARPGDGGQP